MSEPSLQNPLRQLFQPLAVVIGFVLGFGLLVLLGRNSTAHDWHRNFTRFHPMIAPDSMYQPTMGEMCAIVRARCQPDQVLVIVGGNSILQGVGQPADRMWTLRLQEQLGSRYAVINLAFRGSSPTDGGALVCEALREVFPKQIYIANAAPMQAISSIGLESYRFILLDAYFKKMLLPWAPRDQELADYFASATDREHAHEEKLGAQLDAWLHFRDYWNEWSYKRFFTFPTTMSPTYPLAYASRGSFDDEETDYNSFPFDVRFNPKTVEADLAITKATSEPFYVKDEKGNWQPIASAHQGFLKTLQGAFPAPLKKRTLILVGRNSSFYTEKLDQAIRARDDLAYQATVDGWTAAGYESMEYGKTFLPSDYGDRSHLTSEGGEKLATVVAPKVKAIAEKLGYLVP